LKIITQIVKKNAFESVGDSTFITLTRQTTLPENPTVICGSDTVTLSGSFGTAVVLATTGARKVSVDLIKIYDIPGIDLVEHHEYDGRILANADDYSGCADSFWGWYTRDEPFPLQMHPAGYTLDTLHNAGYSNWGFFTAHNARNATDYWFDMVNTPAIANDYYPYLSYTSYTGYNADSINYYIQSRLNNCTLNYWGAYHAAACSANAEFWAIPQAFSGQDPGNGMSWRRPTKSEFQCQTFLALASGAKGILYFKYGYTYANPGWYNYGIKGDADTLSELWYTIRDDINPYIKAIDETYLGLTWDTAFAVSSPTQTFSGLVKSVKATPYYGSERDVNPPPDNGWFPKTAMRRHRSRRLYNLTKLQLVLILFL